MAPILVIFAHDERWEARQLAVSLAVTAASLGDEVHLALFGGALRLFAAGQFDDGAPPEAAAARVGTLSAALADGRALGLRVVACETALRLVGVAPEAAVPPLDAVVSLPVLWQLARSGRALTI